MIPALTAALMVTAASPELLSLQVGLVRVTPHRPGTDQTWVIPAEKKKKGTGFCRILSAGAALTGVGVPLASVGKALCDMAASSAATETQRRLDTSPDIYVRLTVGNRKFRSFTAQQTLSTTFNWKAIIPAGVIPKSGIVLDVLNDDGGLDEDGREVIGHARVTADELQAAAASGHVITLADNGVEKLELLVEDFTGAERWVTQTLDVRQGSAVVKGLSVMAGEVVEVQPRGEYRVQGRQALVLPGGGPGAATQVFQVNGSRNAAPGEALIWVGKHGSPKSVMGRLPHFA